ncbi:hypothetical protein DTO013E5_6723 [Penicillium roqueforti]|uniref:uncharacterized protein n=1 Tax=Penicillium roqueforti TaxID=5082 RepID=UPI00190D1258|nr:uncharacterized protein LCP9604111_6613 [Penicillium roqueforti]KAF9245941.1 hypothetical protein LCP9604111_6613 [Penicillium roqueforti]KAI1834583.1 hypothetical protein CBS147337_4873 [Penicillium roqueforti]KAI2685891.1 hypothetical protein CBS147355_1378 [Penicillium roqueforti]KAI2692092.1 hypothetical protein LCP963914a_186 [Penicillium roqueforti]KAI2705078.1 hypothetical protein CBS147372_1381 [Penicillium roqueforti]
MYSIALIILTGAETPLGPPTSPTTRTPRTPREANQVASYHRRKPHTYPLPVKRWCKQRRAGSFIYRHRSVGLTIGF